MAVLLPNASLTLLKREHQFARDAQGMPVAPVTTVTSVGPLPGGVKETVPDGAWSIRLEPECWPVRAGDEIVDEQGRRWTVTADAQLNQLPGVDDVDYVQATGALNPPQVP